MKPRGRKIPMKINIFRTSVVSGLVVVFLFGWVYINGKSALRESGLTVTADPTTYTQAGEQINYSYTLINTLGHALSGISLKDSFGDVECPASELTSDASMTCTRTYTITADDVSRGRVDNAISANGNYHAAAGCGTCSGNYETASYIGNITVNYLSPDIFPVLNLTKTGQPTTFTVAGEVISYLYTLQNQGNVVLSGPFSVSDDRLSVSCPAAINTLEINSTVMCRASYTTTAADVLAGAIRNSAIAHASYTDGNGAQNVIDSNSASVEILLTAQPALTLVKTADRTCYAAAGDIINYTFKVTNSGNVPLNGPFQVLDNYAGFYPLGCPDVATLQIGEELTCAGYYKVALADIGFRIWNTARATGFYQSETVTSEAAFADVCYTPPTPTPRAGTAPSCSSYTTKTKCEAHSKCTWDVEFQVCREKGQ